MGEESLWDRIIYKKEYRGKTEKDGKVYVKYVRRKRFKAPKVNTVLIVGALLVATLLYLFVRNVVLVSK